MFTLSATCLAIAVANRDGTLRFEVKQGRNGTYIAICDGAGIIEVADDHQDAQDRVRLILECVA